MTDTSSQVAAEHSDEPAYHRLPPAEVARVLEVDPSTGLPDAEVTRRRDEYGPNRLAQAKRRPAWRRLVDQFANPLIAVLAVAAVLAGAVGDLTDAIVIGGVLVLNALLGYVQEGRAEDALAALERMLVLKVTVRRDGRPVDVDSAALVPGDVVLLDAGDRVPADGRLVMASAVAADESMLTGESVPADKRVDVIDRDDLSLADRANELFMNTTVVRGRAELIVTGTGMRTEVGQIAEMLSSEVDTRTPLEKQLRVLGKRLMLVVVVAVAIVLGLALARGVELGEALLEAVALGVAAIPEGLPAVVTVTLAVGVSRMAQRQAIVRRLASVETLGSTTVICTDKTGTLTRNEMTPVEIWHAGQPFTLDDDTLADPAPGSLVRAMQVATLACDASLNGEGDHVGDPTEIAVLLAARAAGVDVDGLRRGSPRHGELPFDAAAKLMATVHDATSVGHHHDTDGGTADDDPDPNGAENDRDANGADDDPDANDADDDRDPSGADDDLDDTTDGYLVAVKGAPDVLLERSTSLAGADGARPFDDASRSEVDAALDRFAQRGQRVLAVASKRLGGDAPPRAPDEIGDALHDLRFEGLVAMVDPPRDGVAPAIDRCHRAGITVKMVTGDHPGTATAIAREIGIAGQVVTGRDLDQMSDGELATAVADIGVCARVSPEHKVRIVDALHAQDEVVAMTGDGVNDAAALRRADVGIAMGIAGTEVTKEAADIVLADDDFTTIVAAVERGRTIYDNILTFVRFQLTTNIAAITTILTAGILGLPAPFTALQILFVNLIADGPPAMALGVDRAREEVMRRRPRAADASILDARVLGSLFPTAAIMTAATLLVLTNTDDATRFTMAFTTFVLLQLANVLAVRGGTTGVLGRHLFTNRWLWAAIGLVVSVQVAVVHVPLVQSWFDTTALSLQQWLIAFGVATLPILYAELLSRVQRRRGIRDDHVGA